MKLNTDKNSFINNYSSLKLEINENRYIKEKRLMITVPWTTVSYIQFELCYQISALYPHSTKLYTWELNHMLEKKVILKNWFSYTV